MNSNHRSESDLIEIDFGKLMRHFLQHGKLLLCCCGAAILLAWGITAFALTPLYRARVTMYVNNTNTSADITEISGQSLVTAQRLVNTYVHIIQSDSVLNEVIQKGNLNCTVPQLRDAMTAMQIQNTEMFTVSVTHPDREEAVHIANTVAQVAPARISAIVEGSSAKVVDYAELPRRPYTPSYQRNLALGGLLGLLLALTMLTMQYYFDMRIQDETDLEEYFTAPVLGAIPAFAPDAHKKH